jgi:hypothetical protein
MSWRGFLILPILISIALFLIGQNQLFRLSDPFDFLAMLLGAILLIVQIVCWVAWLRRPKAV